MRAVRTLRAFVASSQGSITVSPGIPAYAASRSKQLALPTRSSYLAILLHNYLQGPPLALPVVESPARVVKVKMSLSIPRSLRVAAGKAAARYDLSLSELVESLVIHDADREAEEVALWPVRGSTKPVLKLPR